MLWRKQSKEEKALEEIKIKKAQIDKLKEEIVQMGKLVLKDGKLQKVEDTQKPESIGPVPTPPSPPLDFEQQAMKVAEQVRQRMPPPYSNPPQAEPQFPPLPQFPQQQYQQQAYPQYQQQAPPPQFQQQQYQQPPPQYQMPPQFVQQPPQYPPLTVTIQMIGETVIQVNVAQEKIESFIEELNNAVDNQSSFPLGNKIINGRNILFYTFE
jgi:hypothetical protein